MGSENKYKSVIFLAAIVGVLSFASYYCLAQTVDPDDEAGYALRATETAEPVLDAVATPVRKKSHSNIFKPTPTRQEEANNASANVAAALTPSGTVTVTAPVATLVPDTEQ
jgi:hypothetical protein